MNKCFLLNPEKKIGTDSSCHFWEKCKKRTFNSDKWRHWAVKVRSLRFSRKQQDEFAPIFFQHLGLGTHLFVKVPSDTTSLTTKS